MVKYSRLVGSKFNRWTIHAVSCNKNTGRRTVVIQCECGSVRARRLDELLIGHSKSCGCFLREKARELHTTHGACATNMAEYRTWWGMIYRCHKSRNPLNVKHYQQRGIKVCDRWLGKGGLSNFMMDMGNRPSDRHSIDRINNDGNYEPSNCRWATNVEQCNNMRRNRMVTFAGITDTISQMARRFGMAPYQAFGRLYNGWSVDRCFSTPVKTKVPL